MKKNAPICFLILMCNLVFSQTIVDLKQRFNTYLNFKSSLNRVVFFTDKSVSILENNKAEFTCYENEIPCLKRLLLSKNANKLASFYIWKSNKQLSENQLDSLQKNIEVPLKDNAKSLKGKRIALDPGHFAGNMESAKIEQKFIEFYPNPLNHLKDTIRFNEGTLTFQTAEILKNKLEQQGAIVFVTRIQQNYTAFKMTYDTWILNRKKQTLDSLLKVNAITLQRHTTLSKLTKEKLFWEFFRDFELLERARLVNNFKPDATIIIHYNVDEKNTDWLNPTRKNFTMAFIGGGITADNFKKTQNKIQFLRLLLSNQLNESEKLAALTVNQFNTEMQIPIAKQNDADYLRDNCLKTASSGVFCRNLALCRLINSPLVYGECLYQDNEKECLNLNLNTIIGYTTKTPKRIEEAANSYYNAINTYFSSN